MIVIVIVCFMTHHIWNIKSNLNLYTIFNSILTLQTISYHWNSFSCRLSLPCTPFCLLWMTDIHVLQWSLMTSGIELRVVPCSINTDIYIPRFVTLMGVFVKASQSIHQLDKSLRKVKYFFSPHQSRKTAFELFSYFRETPTLNNSYCYILL